MDTSAFVERNRAFWSEFPPKEGRQDLLVEEPSIPALTHGNALYTILLNQSRGLRPVWLTRSAGEQALVQSYVPIARTVWPEQLPLVVRLRLVAVVLLQHLRILVTRDILSFSYDGVKYGDIAYDVYLAEQRVATIRSVDRTLFWIFYRCARRHESVKRLLRSGSYAGVLVSHQVGILSGVLLRAALRSGYEGYLRCGHGTLQRHTEVDHVYDYAFKPDPATVDRLVAHFGERLESMVAEELEKQAGGKATSPDSALAYSPQHRFYRERGAFCEDFGLDPAKNIAFVMLHAMNDHPHSHFRWMLFRDYYDWFEQTLRFAKAHPEVQWVFKQHPSIRFYPVRDVRFDALFHDAPPHVVYISEEKQIDTRSLLVCADWVITCLGSAGFELPALAGIPSIVASDNSYAGLGFAREPRTRKEYFTLLGDIQNVAPLTEAQRQRARATYLYNYRFARMPVTAAPLLSFAKAKDSKQADWYWESVLERYDGRREDILEEWRASIAAISRSDFQKLTRLPSL